MEQEFKIYSEKVKELKSRPPDSTLLILYGLYKQSTEGDIKSSKPGFFDQRGRAKWDAWNNYKGMTKCVAMNRYILKVKGLFKMNK